MSQQTVVVDAGVIAAATRGLDTDKISYSFMVISDLLHSTHLAGQGATPLLMVDLSHIKKSKFNYPRDEKFLFCNEK